MRTYTLHDPIKNIIYRLPSTLRPVPILFGGILLHLTIGVAYSFGNVMPYFVSYLRANVDPNASFGEEAWIFSVQGGVIFTYILAGMVEKQWGPRLAIAIGIILCSGGTAITYFTIKISFFMMFLTFGLIYGIGQGFIYNGTLICATKWLPNNIGLASGILVAGYGCGSFIFSPIQTAYVNPNNYSPNKDGIFTQPDLLARVPTLFLVQSVITLTLQLTGNMLMINPETNELSESSEPLLTPDTTIVSTETSTIIDEEYVGEENWREQIFDRKKIDIKSRDMIRSSTYWVLFFMFFGNTTVMVFVSTFFKSYGAIFIQDDFFLAFISSLSSIFNAIGRPFWGAAADRFSVQFAMAVATSSMFVFTVTLPIAPTMNNRYVYAFWICALYFSLSCSYSLFPTATQKCFGQKNFGVNYGWIIMAAQLNAPLLALVSSTLLAHIGYNGMWYVAAFSVLCSLVLTMCLHRTKYGRRCCIEYIGWNGSRRADTDQ